MKETLSVAYSQHGMAPVSGNVHGRSGTVRQCLTVRVLCNPYLICLTSFRRLHVPSFGILWDFWELSNSRDWLTQRRAYHLIQVGPLWTTAAFGTLSAELFFLILLMSAEVSHPHQLERFDSLRVTHSPSYSLVSAP